MKKFLAYIIAYLGYGQYSVLYGYLNKVGWFYSAKHQISVNGKRNYLPWYSYAFIHYIQDKSFDDFSIFEFGSGNSTLWWSHRCRELISIEHDITFYNLMKDKMPNNVDYKCCNQDNYSDTVKNYKNYFEIIIIDGVQRNKCVNNCLGALKGNGVIIFDNSDREEFKLWIVESFLFIAEVNVSLHYLLGNHQD